MKFKFEQSGKIQYIVLALIVVLLVALVGVRIWSKSYARGSNWEGLHNTLRSAIK